MQNKIISKELCFCLHGNHFCDAEYFRLSAVCKDKIALLKKLEVNVSKPFHTAMSKITNIICEKRHNEFDTLMDSVSSVSSVTAERLRSAWNTDLERADFYRDQGDIHFTLCC